MKRFFRNLLSWLIYSTIFFIILIFIVKIKYAITIGLILGFFAGILNDIIVQLRIINDWEENKETPKKIL